MNVVKLVRARTSLVVLAVVGAVGYGALSLGVLPSGIYPEVDFPRLVVVARVGDLPPAVLQTEIARPMEAGLAGVPGVRRLRTKIIRGAVEINAQFEPSEDMNLALQRAEARLSEAKLPPEAELRVERVTPVALPIISFNLAGADAKLLRDLATYVVAPALTRVAGVGIVDVEGGDVRELEIELDPARLAAAHLRPSDVADKVAAATTIRAVGRTQELRQVLTVLVSAQATIAAIEAIPVTQGASGSVALRSVAQVYEGAEDRTVAISGPAGDVVLVAVSRRLGASAPQVVAAARAAVTALKLPDGVKLQAVYDQSLLIDDAMRGVRDAILIGVGLSFVVLALFLRDLRAGIAAAVAVPLTLVATFGVMRLVGQTLNLMSLGGLAVAIGLVVDDAIVIVEAIVRRRDEGLPPSEAAERGTEDLFAAVVGTTLTTVVVFAPLGLITGVVGSFFGALAITLCASVLLSLLVSVTVVPMVAAKLLRPGGGAGRTGLGRLASGYGRVVRRAVDHPALSAGVLVVLAALGVLAWRNVATGFLPTMDEGAFVLDFFMPPGTSLDETDRQARKIDHVLATTRGVETFTRRTGAEMGPAAATQQSRGDIIVRLAPRGQRDDVYAIIDAVRGRVAEEVPEARCEFIQVMQDMLDDLSGNPRPIEVRIFGADHQVLVDKAKAVAERIGDVPDLVDLFNGVEGEVPALAAVVLPAAAAFGVTAQTLAADLDVVLAGKVAGHVLAGDRSIGIRVRMPDDVRYDPQRIARVPLATGQAGSVPLDALADLGRPVGPAVLQRENQRPVVIIDAAIRGGDLGGVTAAVRKRLEGLDLDPGYQIEIGGQAEGARQTQLDLARVFGLGVLLVLAILVLQLRSLRMALVVLIGAPLALVGAMVTLLATSVPLNASSLMGCVLLAGLVVKNGILLLEHAENELDAGMPMADALVAAGERRLRPILMTTAATIAGLLPLAFAWGAGSELQRPLAVATIGGLVLSTIVTLFAIPALAAALNPRRKGRP